MERWYAVRTQPNREKAAQRWLSPFLVFAPECLEQRNKANGKPYVARCMLFPSYVFLYDALDTAHWSRVNNSEYVVRVMCGTDERPMALPVGFIEDIQARMAWEGDPLPLFDSRGPIFYRDQLLRIIGGPYSGMVAEFQEHRGKRKFEVKVHMFGRSSKAVIDAALVEAA